jgi:CBS domain-containing protein
MIPREMSLQGAARMLTRAGVSGAPVVDDQGHCIGVLSATDFMHWVEADRPVPHVRGAAEPMCSAWQIPAAAQITDCTVEHFMTADPVMVESRTPIAEMARMMIDARIHRLIVVHSMTRQPIGVVSSTDVLAALARAGSADETSANHAMAGANY